MAGPDRSDARTVRLLRHAKSSWDDPQLEDHERPLASRGERAARLMARHLATQKVVVDLVLCSSAIRARQTFDHVLGSIGHPEVRVDAGIYAADRRALWDMLAHLEDPVASVLIVGHNPAMQELADSLVGGGEPAAMQRLSEKFPTGALATVTIGNLSWRGLREGCGYLESFTTPGMLEAS